MDFLIAFIGLGLVVYAITQGDARAAVPAILGPAFNPDPVPNIPFGTVDMTDAQSLALRLIAIYGDGWSPADLMAFVEIESGFDPNAFLPDRNGGSYGLMQVTLPAAQQVGYTGDGPGLFDPATNVRLGVAYLDWIASYLQARLTSASTAEIVAAYNAGVGAVSRGFQDAAYVGKWNAARNRWTATLQGVA